MKIMVFAGISPNTFVYMMDEAEIYYRLGHEVYFVYCTPQAEMCWENMTKNPMKCGLCSRYFNRMRKRMSDGIHQLPLTLRMNSEISKLVMNYTSTYNTVEDIKQIIFNSVHVGMACLSNYISHTRNCNPLIDEEFREYFNELLRSTVRRVLLVDKLIQDVKPDKIVLFNGRATDAKPEWELSVHYGIPFVSCESVCVFQNKYLKRYFNNTIPHSIAGNASMILGNWKNSVLPEEEKEYIGKRFFALKEDGGYSGDKNYISRQIKEKLPENWNENQRNIVIFNSSEDEFAAIGDEYEKVKLFNNQLEAIHHIAAFVDTLKGTSLYLRIHPNLSAVTYKYHTDLLQLDKLYNSLTVIQGISDISTYTLMHHADIVVVFGSTTGVEAVYHKKPTILLGGAVYRNLDLVYIPKDIAELHYYLECKHLESKDTTNAVKLGFYYMNYLLPASAFWSYNFKVYTFGFGKKKHNCLLYENQTLLGSRIVYYLSTKSLICIYRRLFFNRVLKLPLKEK